MRSGYGYQGRNGRSSLDGRSAYSQSPAYPPPQNQSPYQAQQGGWGPHQPYPSQHGQVAPMSYAQHRMLTRCSIRTPVQNFPPHQYQTGYNNYYHNQQYSPPHQPPMQQNFQAPPYRGGHGTYYARGRPHPDHGALPASDAGFAPAHQQRGSRPGTQYSNLSWTPSGGTRGGRPQSDIRTRNHTPGTTHGATSVAASADDEENPFRPSKDLRVEDEATKSGNEMLPPTNATAPEANPPRGFGFSLKPKVSMPEDASSAPEPAKPRPAPKAASNETKPKPVPGRPMAMEPRSETRADKDRDRARDRDHRERDHARARDRDREWERPDRDRERDRRYDGRYETHQEYHDRRPRDSREYRDARDPRDYREGRDYRDNRDRREAWPGRYGEPREMREARESRGTRDSRELADKREAQEGQTAAAAQPAVQSTPKTKTITVRRPKPRPTLPSQWQKSISIYFRKPGNESVIGSGTYGKVFKAVNVYTKEMVALKKIRMEGERDGFPVTAYREIKLLQSTNHPRVVRFLETMVEHNEVYMVFEYLSHDLTGLLNHPSFQLQDAHKKDLAKQLFEGLDYLHRKGILHRDIKAANILVSNTGELKLADFGLARFYEKRRKHDYTNRVVTIWYRPPELLLGETQYGPSVDMWAAGCVLVEIFTNHAIFPGTSNNDLEQLTKIYEVMGTPTLREWPGFVDTLWYPLQPVQFRIESTFEAKYRQRMPAAAFDLLRQMFQWDPVRRPSATEVLEHAYFTAEEPSARRAVELKDVEGEWHEFESKALRKEREKETRRVAREGARREAEKRRAEAGASAEHYTKRLKEDEGE